jgi:hypothetical protein
MLAPAVKPGSAPHSRIEQSDASSSAQNIVAFDGRYLVVSKYSICPKVLIDARMTAQAEWRRDCMDFPGVSALAGQINALSRRDVFW